jgi:hypothetical protein
VTRETGRAPPIYHSFLLRLWRESEHGAWRVALENVTTGERYGFSDLTSLFAFLQTVCQTATAHPWEKPGEHQQ